MLLLHFNTRSPAASGLPALPAKLQNPALLPEPKFTLLFQIRKTPRMRGRDATQGLPTAPAPAEVQEGNHSGRANERLEHFKATQPAEGARPARPVRAVFGRKAGRWGHGTRSAPRSCGEDSLGCALEGLGGSRRCAQPGARPTTSHRRPVPQRQRDSKLGDPETQAGQYWAFPQMLKALLGLSPMRISTFW